MSNIKVPGWIKVNNYEIGRSFYVNSRLVTDIISLEKDKTCISYGKEHYDYITETPEEVMELINESYND